jgi:hypothetical protein
MMDVNRILLQNTLKFSFNLVVYSINKLGEEKQINIKITRKKFLERLGDVKIYVKLVDDYPTKIEKNIFYLKKNGKTIWIWEDESEDII